jgi:trigger factor
VAKQLFTKELVEEMRRLNQPEAVKRLRRKAALDEIVKQEKISADEAELNERVANALEALKGQNIDPSRLRTVIHEEILTENALNWLVEHSQIELVEQGSLKPPAEETLEAIAPEADAADVVTVETTSEEA